MNMAPPPNYRSDAAPVIPALLSSTTVFIIREFLRSFVVLGLGRQRFFVKKQENAKS